FYPVTPASDQYALGAPLFPRITLHLENGRTLLIDAPGNSAENRYVQALRLNGHPYTHNWLSHKTLLQGATLDFTMSPHPDRRRGIKEADRPFSMSTAD
ncbi:MAG TPA: glycoside hydrolase domain-containing protein, partial [Puia sp.]|nr:glycoside hydrolase domain-containing protein [Puia sp.]